MTRKHIGLMLVIIVVAITSGLLLTRGQTIDSTATVTRGSADLTESNVTQQILRLDGTWRFQSSLLDQVDRQSYRHVPHITPHATATYEVDVALPSGHYAIRVPENHPHVRLFIDGAPVERIYSSAKQSDRQAYLVLLEPEMSSFRLTMQINTSNDRPTGLEESLFIGPISSMLTLQNELFSYDFVNVLIACLIFLFYLIVSIFHRKESIYLYGAAFFFLVALSLLMRDQIVFELIPSVAYIVAHKVSLIAVMLSVCMLIEFAIRLERVPFERFLQIATYPLYLLSAVAVILPYNAHSGFDYGAWIYILFITFFWSGLNVNWLFERKTTGYPLEFFIFTLAMILGYIGQTINVLIPHPNQSVYTSVLSLTFFVLMFMLLPVHLSTDKRQKQEVQTFADQSEISFFNAQIKPHFLYNTFGNVIALCYTAPHEAARLLGHLSTYVRFIFENGRTETTITLGQELEMIDSYLSIEQTRFNDAFTVIKDIDESLTNFEVPPLLIQPLVENAIRHGLMKKNGKKRLMLAVQDLGSAIEIRIADNGLGFDPKHTTMPSSGIGIPNVRNRIAYLSNATFKIQSEIGVGTHVQIRLPKHERMNVPNAHDFD
ncbi:MULTISPECIES: sensor histidine kinase [Exiguobacterium]|uniref:sensor histidine kinase n=1 Tax=Exiguobacterium TaxID=33986 RepID=UPI001BE76F15|nr:MULTISPECIES: histidine kinase [Exiguobacterium]MCT4782578.1 histidine kinase [Exiguobacterium himgiriensis]